MENDDWLTKAVGRAVLRDDRWQAILQQADQEAGEIMARVFGVVMAFLLALGTWLS